MEAGTRERLDGTPRTNRMAVVAALVGVLAIFWLGLPPAATGLGTLAIVLGAGSRQALKLRELERGSRLSLGGVICGVVAVVIAGPATVIGLVGTLPLG